ncbi:MAG TPA: hypothetical protein PKI34_01065 [Bacteroidales bacterium]|nr:hypothetical protein [Bacteroidales bacterium]
MCQVVQKDSTWKKQQAWKKEWLLKSLQISGSSSDLNCRLSFLTLSQLPGKKNHFLNRITGDEELEYTYFWSRKGFTVTLKMISEFGCIYFPDSLFYKQKDIQTFRYDLSSRVKKNWQISLNASAKTPVYPMVAFSLKDSANQVTLFTGSLLTPLKMIISAGIKLTIRELGSVYAGLSSLKVVYVLDQQIFTMLGVTSYNGVEQGNRWYYEYGLSSSFDLEKKLTPYLHWQCHLEGFLARNESLDLLLKNLFSIKAGKSMNANLQSRIVYDRGMTPEFQLENQLSVGFVIRLSR